MRASHSRLWKISLIAQALLYVAGGVNHLWHTATYLAIMPPHYSHPVLLIQISGVAEVLGGIGLLVPWSRRFAAFGLIAMLIVYFDVHFYMAVHPERFAPLPAWALYARIPLQFLLIAWAWVYTRRGRLSFFRSASQAI